MTISIHDAHEFLLRMEEAGLTDRLIRKVVDWKDNSLAAKMIKIIKKGGFDSTTTQKRAREIMGTNYFGIEEAIKHFEVEPTKQQLDTLLRIPFPEDTLEELKETHVLISIFPLSINDVQSKVGPSLFFRRKNRDDWPIQKPFAKEQGDISWQLVRKTLIDNSICKNWQEQQALIGEDDKTPDAQVMVQTIIGYYLATGKRLFERGYTRTSSLATEKKHVCVGNFYLLDGLDVCSTLDIYRFDGLGISSARKI